MDHTGAPRRKQTRSCDACRLRKTKCERPESVRIVDGFGSESCRNCVAWKVPCSYMTARTRRGRKSDVLERLAEQQQERLSQRETPVETRASASIPPISPLWSRTEGDMNISTQSTMPTRVDDILRRDQTVALVKLYFQHLHPVTPVVHRPAFLDDLAACKDQSNGKFHAILLGIISAAILFMPPPLLTSIDVDTSIALTCVRACEVQLAQDIHSPDADTVAAKYLLLCAYEKMGSRGAKASVYGELQYLVVWLGYHTEASYAGLDPINSERRRRLWALIHNADKYEALSGQSPVMLRSDEFGQETAAAPPAELDDDYITSEGYLPSHGEVAYVSGINVLTRTVTVLGDILIAERSFQRQPLATPELLMESLKGIRLFTNRLRDIAYNLPRPFALANDHFDLPSLPGSQGALIDEINSLAQDPGRYNANQDGYHVLKADIHVTLAVTRLRMIYLRERQLDMFGPVGHPSRNVAELLTVEVGHDYPRRLNVYQDLLRALQSLPICALAVNGPALVTKIRLVALTLVDDVQVPENRVGGEKSLFDYLMSFLGIISNIETLVPAE